MIILWCFYGAVKGPNVLQRKKKIYGFRKSSSLPSYGLITVRDFKISRIFTVKKVFLPTVITPSAHHPAGSIIRKAFSIKYFKMVLGWNLYDHHVMGKCTILVRPSFHHLGTILLSVGYEEREETRSPNIHYFFFGDRIFP